ncbi:MAG: hypothetical protein JSU86_12425 [Phycisphaerales bacterium]|nr:MAG: hypothetical protein JSU86_12425 [Phycisphaerales bacterium]
MDIDKAWKILRSVARLNDIVSRLVSCNSVVFEPNRWRLLVLSKNGRLAPQYEPVTLNAAELLTGEGAVGSCR